MKAYKEYLNNSLINGVQCNLHFIIGVDVPIT